MAPPSAPQRESRRIYRTRHLAFSPGLPPRTVLDQSATDEPRLLTASRPRGSAPPSSCARPSASTCGAVTPGASCECELRVSEGFSAPRLTQRLNSRKESGRCASASWMRVRSTASTEGKSA